jgi:GNAT superfamily N-acetyltransferase
MSAWDAVEAALAAANLALRRAEPADADIVRAVVRAAYAKWVPVIGREPAPMQADYDRAVREHRIDLAVGEDGVVGLIETMRRPDHLWIENIAVRPGRHGQGVGRLLLRHAEAVAAAEGLGALRLLTNGAFAANIALYQRVGYVIERTEPFLDGVTVYMAKAPTGAPPCAG